MIEVVQVVVRGEDIFSTTTTPHHNQPHTLRQHTFGHFQHTLGIVLSKRHRSRTAKHELINH